MKKAQPLVLYDPSDSSDSEIDEDTHLSFPPNYSKWDTQESDNNLQDPLDHCGTEERQQTEGKEEIPGIRAEDLNDYENSEIQSDDSEREGCEPHASCSMREDETESKDRQPYKLPESLLLSGTRRLLLDVATFFSKPVNLQRATAAIGDTTRDKTRERLLCKFNKLNVLVFIVLNSKSTRSRSRNSIVREVLKNSLVATNIAQTSSTLSCAILVVFKDISRSRRDAFRVRILIRHLYSRDHNTKTAKLRFDVCAVLMLAIFSNLAIAGTAEHIEKWGGRH